MYAVQTACMPEAVLNSKGISSTSLKRTVASQHCALTPWEKQYVKIHRFEIGSMGGQIMSRQFVMKRQRFM